MVFQYVAINEEVYFALICKQLHTGDLTRVVFQTQSWHPDAGDIVQILGPRDMTAD